MKREEFIQHYVTEAAEFRRQAEKFAEENQGIPEAAEVVRVYEGLAENYEKLVELLRNDDLIL